MLTKYGSCSVLTRRQMPSEDKMMMMMMIMMLSQSPVDRLDQVRSGKWNGLEGDRCPLQWVIICDDDDAVVTSCFRLTLLPFFSYSCV